MFNMNYEMAAQLLITDSWHNGSCDILALPVCHNLLVQQTFFGDRTNQHWDKWVPAFSAVNISATKLPNLHQVISAALLC